MIPGANLDPNKERGARKVVATKENIQNFFLVI